MSDIKIESQHQNRAHHVLCAVGHEHQWRYYMDKFWELSAVPSDFPETEGRLFDAIYQQYATGREVINTAELGDKEIKLLTMLRNSTSAEELDERNFADNVDRLIKYGQQVHAIRRIDQARQFLDDPKRPPDMDEIMALNDDLSEIVSRQTGVLDVSGSGYLISNARQRFKNVRGTATPTGIPGFDTASHGGLRALQLLGLIGIFKGRKTTLWLNSMIRFIRYSISEETAIERVYDLLIKKPDFVNRHWEEVAFEINLVDKKSGYAYEGYRKHIEAGITMFKQGLEFKPRGTVFLSIEKSAEEVYDNLIAMLAIDHLIKGTAIRTVLHNEGHSAETLRKIGEPHPTYGYMTCQDAPFKNTYDSASFISRTIIKEQGDYESEWIVRRIAINLAIEEIEMRWGRRVRVYDATPRHGNLGSLESVLRTLTQDSRN